MNEAISYIPVFISYSSENSAFAKNLSQTLESYTAPRSLNLAKRVIRTFRYESDMTGVDYKTAIINHLMQCEKLIVLSSPDARASEYVDEEIRLFHKFKPVSNIIPILIAGIPNNETVDEKEKAFPESLAQIYGMPLSINFRGAGEKENLKRGFYENSWFSLLAEIFDRSRREIEQREKKKIKRKRIISYSIIALIFLILSIFSLIIAIQRNVAQKERKQAELNLAKSFVAQGNNLLTKGDVHLGNNLYKRGEMLFLKNNSSPIISDFALWSSNYLYPAPEHHWNESHSGWPRSLIFPDPTKAIIGKSQGDIYAVDLKHGQERILYKGDGSAIMNIFADPSKKYIVAGSRAGIILKFDYQSLDTLFTVKTNATISAIAISNKYNFIATAHINGDIKIWNLKDGHFITILKHHQGNVAALVALDDISMLASAGYDKDVIIWNSGTLKFSHSIGIKQSAAVTALDISQDGQYIASGNMNGEVHIFPVSGTSEAKVYHYHTGCVRQVRFSYDGSIFSSSDDGNILETVFATDHPVITRTLQTKAPVFCFDINGNQLMAGTRDSSIWQWQLDDETWFSKITPPIPDKIRGIFIDKLSDRWLLVSEQGNVWELKGERLDKRNLLFNIGAHFKKGLIVDTKHILITLDSLGTLASWDMNTFKYKRLCIISEVPSSLLYWPAEDVIVANIEKDSTIQLLSLTGEKVHTCRVKIAIHALAVDDFNNQLVVMDGEHRLHYLNTKGEEVTRDTTALPVSSKVLLMKLFPKEQLLFMGFEDHTLLIYDLIDKNILWRFTGTEYAGFRDQVNQVILTDDGTACITVKDRLINIYRLENKH